MKRIILFASILVLALSGAMVSCYFDAARDNPNDPESDGYTEPIYIFSTGTQWGNLDDAGGTPGNGRTGANSLCVAHRDSTYPKLPSTHVYAFIGVVSGDGIKDMPSKYNVPTNRKISSHSGKIIATNWDDLFNGLSMSLNEAEIIDNTDSWWSGSNPDGSVVSDFMYRCDGWTDGGGTYKGAIGASSTPTNNWLNWSNVSCNAAAGARILCICWDD